MISAESCVRKKRLRSLSPMIFQKRSAWQTGLSFFLQGLPLFVRLCQFVLIWRTVLLWLPEMRLNLNLISILSGRSWIMMSEISYHQQQYIRHQKREKKLVLFLRIFILLFFLVLWEISARTGLIDSFIFSSPVMIWHSFCSMCRDGSIFPHLSVTITETLVSFLFVVILGAGMAVLLWTCPRLAKITEPYLCLLYTSPSPRDTR